MPYEIEKKYLINKFPKHLNVISESIIEQIYLKITDDIESRVMNIIYPDGDLKYILTSRGSGELARENIECEITFNHYNDLLNTYAEYHCNAPAIIKEQKILEIPDTNYRIEYNIVDKNISGGWRYIEVKFKSIEEAENFDMTKYISNAVEITNHSEFKMKNYWLVTRSNISPSEYDTAVSLSESLHPHVNAVRDYINKVDQLIYNYKNKVGEYPNSGYNEDNTIFVIPGGFRNIRLAVMANEFKVNPPHFHFFKHTSPIDKVTGKHGGALLINDTIHFKHDSHQDRINYVEIKALKKFLTSNYPDTDISIWKFILNKWNEMNPQVIQKINVDAPIPEYFHNMRVQFGKHPRNPNKGKMKINRKENDQCI